MCSGAGLSSFIAMRIGCRGTLPALREVRASQPVSVVSKPCALPSNLPSCPPSHFPRPPLPIPLPPRLRDPPVQDCSPRTRVGAGGDGIAGSTLPCGTHIDLFRCTWSPCPGSDEHRSLECREEAGFADVRIWPSLGFIGGQTCMGGSTSSIERELCGG